MVGTKFNFFNLKHLKFFFLMFSIINLNSIEKFLLKVNKKTTLKGFVFKIYNSIYGVKLKLLKKIINQIY
jgi:hypothetical protein